MITFVGASYTFGGIYPHGTTATPPVGYQAGDLLCAFASVQIVDTVQKPGYTDLGSETGVGSPAASVSYRIASGTAADNIFLEFFNVVSIAAYRFVGAGPYAWTGDWTPLAGAPAILGVTQPQTMPSITLPGPGSLIAFWIGSVGPMTGYTLDFSQLTELNQRTVYWFHSDSAWGGTFNPTATPGSAGARTWGQAIAVQPGATLSMVV